MKRAVAGLKRDGGVSPVAEIVQMAAFAVGSEQYALDIMRIKEIINPLKITPVPRAPAFIEGVVELRGQILPVVDMRKRFGLPATRTERATKYLIVTIEGAPVQPEPAQSESRERITPSPDEVHRRRWIVGLIVDGVQEVIRVPRSEIRPAPPIALGGDSPCFSGVCQHRDRIVMVVDLDRLLSVGERSTLDRFGGKEGA